MIDRRASLWAGLRRRALLGVGFALLVALRAFGVPAHVALEHSHELFVRLHDAAHEGHGHDEHEHEHVAPASGEPCRREAPRDHEHSLEDHLRDLLVHTSGAVPACDLALVPASFEPPRAPGRGLRPVARAERRPRARSPAPPTLRGPPTS